MLRTVVVVPGEAEYKKITDSLPQFFPPEELLPANLTAEEIPYLCFYDDGEFIGFSQVLKYPDLHFLSYMAMLPQYRSKGYGGKMLDLVLSERGTVPLTLDIEALDPQAANYEQRIRRYNFYLKHGLSDSGYDLIFGGVKFMIMTTGEADAMQLMQKHCAAYKHLPPGLLQIVKREKAAK